MSNESERFSAMVGEAADEYARRVAGTELRRDEAWRCFVDGATYVIGLLAQAKRPGAANPVLAGGAGPAVDSSPVKGAAK